MPFGNGFNNSSGVITITSRSGATTNQRTTPYGSSGFTEDSYPISSWLPSISETVTSTGIIESNGSQVFNISGGSSSSGRGPSSFRTFLALSESSRNVNENEFLDISSSVERERNTHFLYSNRNVD